MQAWGSPQDHTDQSPRGLRDLFLQPRGPLIPPGVFCVQEAPGPTVHRAYS